MDGPFLIYGDNVYDKLLSLMTLSSEHRKELQDKRGFTDETIDKFGFKSAIRPDKADEVKEEMLKHFSEEELKGAKILLSADDISPKTDSQVGDLTFTVVGERIVVPFFGSDGSCTYLRQHKFGLSGTTPHIYDATREGSSTLILTEGEFKATALHQLAYSAAASPGISLFGGKNFGILEDWIQAQDVNQVHIMFDGEIKNDPIRFPDQYKEDKRVRHDTDWWAYKLCRMLEQSGISTKVVVWPESWLIGGKIDPDAAIANGKVREDFDALLENSYTHKEFRKSWSGEKKQVLEQKAKKEAYKSDIVQKNGQYFKKTKRGDEYVEVPFTNFTMEIIAKNTTRSEDTDKLEIIRETRITSQDGESTSNLSIEPIHFTSSAEFKKALMSSGDYQYTGTSDDLTNLVNRLFAEQEVKDCQRPIQVGRIKEDKFDGVFMGNVAFTEHGVHHADDEGGFWINDIYVRPDSYIVGASCGVHLNTQAFDWREGINKMCEAYGSQAPKMLVLWEAASLFKETFFNARGGTGFFPLMYVGGGYKSGKTTVTGQAMNFLGMGDIMQLDISTTTKAGLDRSMKYYSSLPLWIDELRSDDNFKKYEGSFRGAYNGASGIKAMRSGTSQVRTTDVNCTLLLTGQETPPDAALNERMIKVNINSGDRPKDSSAFKWLSKNMRELSNMSYELLSRSEEIRNYVKKEYVDNADDMNERIENARVAGNYAVILTMAECLGLCDEDFEEYIFEAAFDSCRESEEKNESMSIFNEVLDMMHEEKMPASKYFGRTRCDTEVWCAWTKMFSKYKEIKRRRGESVMEEGAIINQLLDNKTVLSRGPAKIDGHSTRCVKLYTKNLPAALVEYIEDKYNGEGDF